MPSGFRFANSCCTFIGRMVVHVGKYGDSRYGKRNERIVVATVNVMKARVGSKISRAI